MSRGLKRDKALAICGISKDQYYHKPGAGKRGRKRTGTTQRVDAEGKCEQRSNTSVIEFIRTKLQEPFVDYGYRKMSSELQLAGFKINHKKVYRLMKSNGLLRPKTDKRPRNYVKYRRLIPDGPYRLMEMDIKQIWLETERRYLYVLTILDVFDRRKLYQTSGYHMTQLQVQQAWQEVIENHLEPNSMHTWEVNIEIRSDNGPQFCARKLQAFFEQNQFVRTYTHPYTPQENGHVESYHAILNEALQRHGPFSRRTELDNWLKQFEQFYNFERPHGSLLGLPPMTFHAQWKEKNIDRTIIDEKLRRVKFTLKVCRTTIRKVPAGNENPREACA